MKPITIGKAQDFPFEYEMPPIKTNDLALFPHINTPWFRAQCASDLGIKVRRKESREARTVAIDREALQRHIFVAGASGSGKSRLTEHLLIEQIKAGCSALVIDPKGETFRDLLRLLQLTGIHPRQVVVLDPRSTDGIPGWNPCTLDLPVSEIVGDLASVIERFGGTTGPRVRDLLFNALTVIVTFKLSIYELTRLLTNGAFTSSLLIQTIDLPIAAF